LMWVTGNKGVAGSKGVLDQEISRGSIFPCGTPGMVNSGGTLLQMAGCHVEGGMALHAHSAHTVYNLLTVEPGCTSTQLTEKKEATISRD